MLNTCRYMRGLLCTRSVALSKDLQVHEWPFMYKECCPLQRLAGTWGAFYVQGVLPSPKICRYMMGLLCARSLVLSKDLQIHEEPFMYKEHCPLQRLAGTWGAFYVQGVLTFPKTCRYMRGLLCARSVALSKDLQVHDGPFMCKEHWPLQILSCTWGAFVCARNVDLSKDLHVHEGLFMCKEHWPLQRGHSIWFTLRLSLTPIKNVSPIPPSWTR